MSVIVAATSAPRPPDELIGPGIAGFVAIFLLAVGVIVLMRDMNRRVQRLRYGGGRVFGRPAPREDGERSPHESPSEPGGGSTGDQGEPDAPAREP